jgi:putative nucleotidyltransferase with HDIG domain
VDDLVSQASAEAARYLETPALAQRWAHVQAVGARAAELAATVDPADRDLLVAAALLHDIGYAPELVVTGFHPLDGARHLQRAGFPERVVALVAHHSGARFEAAERGLLRELEAYPLEDSAVMDALVTADLTTGPHGQRFSYDERLDEILTRYPVDSAVHRAMCRARPVLAEHVQRVETRVSR